MDPEWITSNHIQAKAAGLDSLAISFWKVDTASPKTGDQGTQHKNWPYNLCQVGRKKGTSMHRTLRGWHYVWDGGTCWI